MHPYSTDSKEREQVLLALAALAIVLALALSLALKAAHLTVPWWLDAPATMGFYGILFKWFDERLWRWPPIRWTRLLKVPILAGEWQGHVLSSFDDHKKPHAITLRIKQTWTRIVVLLSSGTSDSHTLTASIQIAAPEGVVLTYQYQNQPRPDALKTMEMHIGTARLVFMDGSALEGYYYSGRGRREFGSIHVVRVKS